MASAFCATKLDVDTRSARLSPQRLRLRTPVNSRFRLVFVFSAVLNAATTYDLVVDGLSNTVDRSGPYTLSVQ